MTTDTTALAALLASHPEECAAVLCALCVSAVEPATAQHVFFYLRHQTDHALPLDIVALILSTMGEAGLVTVSGRVGGVGSYFVLVAADRYAIARQGAAAWLAARVGAPVTTLDRISAAFDHLAAVNVIADGLSSLDREAVEQARLRLFVVLEGTAHAKRGIPAYGEDEVRERGATTGQQSEQARGAER